MADPFVLFGSGCSREMGDPCIDPPDGIRNICAIDGDLITDEEVFCHILLDPFTITALLLNRPFSFAHLPYLMGGFVDHLTVRRDCEQGEEKQNEEEHVSY
jgi:hypothetical protein